MFADLHLHTNFSDGTYTPEELTGHGQRLGFAALALTDHDTMEGCARMAAACATAGIEFIPASEFTAEHDNIELHLLGYFLNTTHPRLLSELAKFQIVRQQRIREMVARLNTLGIPLQADAVFALANCAAPGRPHVARALVQAKQCATVDEAFDRFLKKGKPASAAEILNLGTQAGLPFLRKRSNASSRLPQSFSCTRARATCGRPGESQFASLKTASTLSGILSWFSFSTISYIRLRRTS